MTAKGYWVVNLDVADPEQYAKYQAFVRPFLAEIGGTFLVRGGQHEVMEGTSRSRQVVVEFESYRQALAAYRSDVYQSGMRDRLGASVANFVIVEGRE
jgi:uncharacterized protein (DUF1330 family)